MHDSMTEALINESVCDGEITDDPDWCECVSVNPHVLEENADKMFEHMMGNNDGE